jgi:hypothetical protein
MTPRRFAICFAALVAASQSASNIVSVSDLHGDYKRAVKILEAASLIDPHTGAWIGGNTTLVQTGDMVDRGAESIQLYRLFKRLAEEAEEQGGQVINLLGNHELMNIQGDFRYVNRHEMQAAGGQRKWQEMWEPDGEIGSQVRKFKAAVTVGPVLFVHAGLFPAFLDNNRSLEDVNKDMSAALDSNGYPWESELQSIVENDGPLWTRFFTEDSPSVCSAVLQVLKQVGAQRMVVGHTIQPDSRVNPLCSGSLILADTAISRAYGGDMSFIEYNGTQDAIVHYPCLGPQTRCSYVQKVLPRPLLVQESLDVDL